jgi:peptidoglycan/xylan/chitin deacetylase (PgdA/CDA1 family)
MPRSTVCLTFDFDAMSVWFGYEHVTPAMLQRGEYGARVGVPRLLQMLERERLPATFFVPGHTLESFPEPSQQILEAGHEVAHHSYAHVDPSGQAADDERADFERALGVFAKLGVTPVGYRSRVGLSAPSKVLEIWQGELDYMHEHVDGGVLVVAMHPQVIGRGHRVAMLERFVEHARALGDVTFAEMRQVAAR